MPSTPRLRGLAIALAVVVAVIAGMLVDAAARRQTAVRNVAARIEVARALGMPDLVLSSTSRWLRHPSQVEPGAPFADAPASLDTDPGGAVVGPPRTALGAGAEDAVIRSERDQ